MKYHDNVVQILNSYDDIFSLWKDNDGKYGSFTIRDFKISSGQDPQNKIQKGQKYDIRPKRLQIGGDIQQELRLRTAHLMQRQTN